MKYDPEDTMLKAVPDLSFQFKNRTANDKELREVQKKISLFQEWKDLCCSLAFYCLCWVGRVSLVCAGAKRFVPMPQSLCWCQKDFDRDMYWNLPLWDRKVDPWLQSTEGSRKWRRKGKWQVGNICLGLQRSSNMEQVRVAFP